jgi:hypothetical protein
MHKEKFQECHMKDIFDQEHKNNFFLEFFLDVNF